jgi:hypothetical protein
MCDFSLHGIETRLAEEGEILVVHRFYTGSKGLTSTNSFVAPQLDRLAVRSMPVGVCPSFLAFKQRVRVTQTFRSD